MTRDSIGHQMASPAGATFTAERGELRFAADPDTIRDWLNSPSAADPTMTVAEHLDIDEFYSVDDIDFSFRADNLLLEGQEAGVFGVPGHRISLVDVADKEDHSFAGHLLLVDRPDGSRQASDYIDPDDLTDPGLYGIDAAVSFYDNLADHANGVLAQTTRSATTPPSDPHPDLTGRVLAAAQQLHPADTSPAARMPRETAASISEHRANDMLPQQWPQPEAAARVASASGLGSPAGLAAASFAAPAAGAAGAGAVAGSSVGPVALQHAAAAVASRAAGPKSPGRSR